MTPTNGLRPVHPGEILREDFLIPLGLSVNALAAALRVPATRLHEIVKERRSITPDTALRLARYFGGDAQSWLNLQVTYYLKTTEREAGPIISREVQPRATAGNRPAGRVSCAGSFIDAHDTGAWDQFDCACRTMPTGVNGYMSR